MEKIKKTYSHFGRKFHKKRTAFAAEGKMLQTFLFEYKKDLHFSIRNFYRQFALKKRRNSLDMGEELSYKVKSSKARTNEKSINKMPCYSSKLLY